ncbi:MAG: LysR family transcriptional regulator [Rhizobiaceae bacterium]
MNVRQLEAFRATMETGSITGAAELLHVSQPSVSRLIGDLERSVGFPLFLRAGRGLTATIEARRFHKAVDSMFIGVGRLQELAEVIKTTADGVLSVGVIPSLSQSALPEAVAQLLEAKPDMRLMLSTRNTPAIIDAVRMQQFDLGLVGREPPYDGVEILYQTTLPYLCLLPEGHRQANETGPLDLEQLSRSDRFVTFGDIYPDKMTGIERSLSLRLQENSRISVANMPMAAALVKSTGSLAIVDPFTASLAVQTGGVVSRPLLQEMTYHVAIITRGLDTLPREAREFADLLSSLIDQAAA